MARKLSSREQRLVRLGRALGGMLHKAEESLDAAAREGKIHPTDLRCISFLGSADAPVSPKEIIAYLGITSATGTALLDRLERFGYVTRSENPADRRSVLISLDRKAAAQPIQLLEELRAQYAKVTERYSEEQLDVIVDYLERVARIGTTAKP